ncbi:hypothetical protein LIA77_08749 [Sarocladium implicatum]|nr:hypothetical protein LIA77_08749 [Sarocladium implicatum]
MVRRSEAFRDSLSDECQARVQQTKRQAEALWCTPMGKAINAISPCRRIAQLTAPDRPLDPPVSRIRPLKRTESPHEDVAVVTEAICARLLEDWREWSQIRKVGNVVPVLGTSDQQHTSTQLSVYAPSWISRESTPYADPESCSAPIAKGPASVDLNLSPRAVVVDQNHL